MLLVVLLLCCLSATANSAAASSCASCTDLTIVSGANGTDVVLATIRLIEDSDLFVDDHQILRRIAHVETRDGASEASGGGGIWAVNETGFASLVEVNATGIRAYFGIEWSSVTWSDLSVPLYSGLAARLLINQLAGGYDLSSTSSQAMLWADSYGGNAEKYINDTVGLTDYRYNNIDSLEFGMYYKSTITTTSYFKVMASNATSILQLVLSVNGDTQLYVSNLIEPSAAFHCNSVKTNSTANLLLNASQLYKNEDERNVLYISIEVVQATEVSLGVSAIELDKGSDPIDTQAEEFVIGLFDNHPDAEYTPLLISVATRETSPFTVTVETQAGIAATETINPTDILSIVLPDTYLVTNNSERYKGVIVKAESGRTISVSVSNYDQFSSDSYLALPLYQYSGVTEYVYYAITPETDSSLLQNRVLLVGGYNDTNITIKPKETVYIPPDLSPTGLEYELSSNESLTIQLNRFQTLLLESEMSLSGSKFTTTKPVTFLSGHQCALIPSDATNRSCDIIIEQLPPTLNWGKTFIFPLLSSQTGGAFITILAAENNTEATLRCTSISTNANTTDVSSLNTTGDFITYLISPDDLVCSIISDNPVLVTIDASSEGDDDSNGDPFMMLVPPTKQYSNATHYFAPFSDNFTSNYINIALLGQPGDVFLDNASITDASSVYDTTGSLLGYALQLNSSAENRTLSVAYGSNTVYTAWIYGFDFAVSYGQSLGMNLLITGDDRELTVAIESHTYSSVGMIQIICSTTGPPVYITDWYKGGDLIYPSCKHSITSSNTTISILTISSVNIDDIGQYTCTARSYYTSRSATAVIYVTLQTPFPLLSLSTDPSNYSQLVSATSPLFTCSAVIDYTIFNPDELAVVFEWLRNGASISIYNSAYNITNSTLSSTLNILSLGTQDNNAVYSCVAYVNPVSSSPYLINNSDSIQITLQVQAFSSGHVSFDITKLPSVPTSGGTVNISCQINVPERFYVMPDFVRLAYSMNGSNAVDSTQEGYTEEDLVYFTKVALSNINTSDATTYYCVIAFNTLGVTAHAFTNLSMNLAPSTLDIIPRHNDSIYESSLFSLTCEVTLPSSVDTPVSLSYVWRNPYGSTIHYDDRISFYVGPRNETLIFNPIDNGDSNSMQTDAGQYTCQVQVIPNNVNVNSASYVTTSDSLVIEDLPELVLEITYSLDAPAEGDSLNITCTVTYPESLIIVPTVLWSLPISGSLPETRTSSLTESLINVTLSLNPVLYDYNGVYSCVAEYNVTSYSFDHARNSTEYELDVPLIIPNVSITGYPLHEGAFAAGTNVHLLCRVDLSFENKNLVITWSHDNVTLTNDSTYIVGPVQRASDYYYGILTINGISLDDNEDTYKCTSLIYHSNQDTIATSCESFNVTVSDVPIVTLYPMELIVGYGNEARFECLYSSDISSNVSWFKDGQSLSHETYNIYTNGTHSVLTITSTTTADNGTYSCSVNNSIGTTQDTSALLIGVLTVNISPLPVTVLEYRDTVNVTCLANSNLEINDLSYTWLLDGIVIDVNESFIEITYTSSDQVDDSGEYHCQVSSETLSLTIESQRTLIALTPVIVANPLPALGTLVNDSIKFICNATGYPFPSIEWRRISVENDLTTLVGIDSVTIDLPYNITNDSSINVNEVSSVLTLQSVDYDDFGYYVCIATLTSNDVYVLFDNSNVTLMDYHAISSTATLTVSPYGSVQVNPSSVTAYFGDTVAFNCTSRGGPNNQYAWYRVAESRNISVGLMNQLEVEINSIELTARYYCNVTNDAGSSSAYTILNGNLSVSTIPSTATVLNLGDSV
ncbi:PREDICTED: titin-like, partial [Amphimedon queenslandica]|uniref:Ig-like domain-containing protein n=1 Tax=Amphimedon queenslandica TaxID=400682 RepID=A0AAN0IZJ3_AMPQE